MATCTVRWRPSGGRGEFEYVPADALKDRTINVFVEALGLTIPAEVRGVKAQGKPRIRKFEKNNRKKLHLPQLVMAIARLPEPARQDLHSSVTFPLENKSFVMDSMDFDIIEDDGIVAQLAPLRVSILHSVFQIDLQDRFDAIARDIAGIEDLRKQYPELAKAVAKHNDIISLGTNSLEIRKAADRATMLQTKLFGMTNAGSAIKVDKYFRMPQVEIEEEITGKEGKILTRIHSYKERDRKFVLRVKKDFMSKNDGKLICEACGLDSLDFYGTDGGRCIEAHHKIPIEELQPDSITRVDEMALVCASCHRIIHCQKPCLTIKEVMQRIESAQQSMGS